MAVRAVVPQAILDDVSAEADVRVLILIEAIDVLRLQAAAAGQAARDLIGVDVERLPLLRRVAAEEGAAELVAARLADELRLHAGRRRLGGVRRRIDLHLFHAADVRIVAERARGFSGVETLEDHAHLAGGAIHDEALLRAVGAAAHVDACHLHGRRLRQQREVIARRRQR